MCVFESARERERSKADDDAALTAATSCSRSALVVVICKARSEERARKRANKTGTSTNSKHEARVRTLTKRNESRRERVASHRIALRRVESRVKSRQEWSGTTTTTLAATHGSVCIGVCVCVRERGKLTHSKLALLTLLLIF